MKKTKEKTEEMSLESELGALGIVAVLVGVGCLYARVFRNAEDVKAKADRVNALADENYRRHLIATGEASEELLEKVEVLRVPERFREAARIALGH